MTTTSPTLRDRTSDESLRKFNLRTQISRAWINALAYPMVLLMMPSGLVTLSVLEATLITIISVSSSLVVYQLYRAGFDRDIPFNLNYASLCLDAILISAVIYFDGGIRSMFFIFYLSNLGAATFLKRLGGMYGMMVIDLVAYFTTLSMLGQLDGFGPATMSALGRLMFLYGAAFLPLRGIAELQMKNRYIRQIRVEEALKVEALSRLTEELEQQSRELSDANLQIREANRLKSQFLASMSHELRTPLNSIIGFSSILEDNLGETMEPRYKKFLGNILGSSQHLLSLINDLLDLSKIEAGKVEVNPEPFPVAELLAGVHEIMRGQSDQRSIEIRIDTESHLPLLDADPSKFRQIVFNLLSNAVKFSPDGSTVHVRVSSVAASDSKLGVPSIRLEVEDHGIGIAPHELDVIFEEFRQAEDGFVRQYGGTGLGLTLVQRFLEIQGGTIDVSSELGSGSTFTVLIPQHVEPVEIEGSDEPEMGRACEPLDLRPRVLIVEDDPIAYVNLSTILHSEGYATVRARTGDVVRSVIERDRPVAIALDLVLPGLDGWKVLEELRADPQTRHLPIIVVTLQKNRELGLTLGADDFFIKPVDPDRFVRRLEELILEKRRTGPPTVLLIDDDAAMHEILADRIMNLGYRVVTANNGADGLHAARAERPDLIVLDLLMPALNGFETLDQLRHDPLTRSIPVIIMTEKELAAAERAAIGDQIVGLFAKHTRAREEFITTLHELLSRTSRPVAGAD